MLPTPIMEDVVSTANRLHDKIGSPADAFLDGHSGRPTIIEPEAWRAAALMTDLRGADAVSAVAGEIASAVAKGDLDGFLAWKQVLTALYELQREERDEGELVN